MPDDALNLWDREDHAALYLDRADTIPHRAEGEAAFREWLPAQAARVLDLGSGDGRLLSVVLDACRPAEAVALDFSPLMLDRLRRRFAAESRVAVVAHNLDEPLPEGLDGFDAVVSSFAIHHLAHARKRTLYAEIHACLRPGGVFLNLEHVASPTPALHHAFLATLGVRPEEEDPSNKLLGVEEQLGWLREIGYAEVDCHWKWRELALLAGVRRQD